VVVYPELILIYHLSIHERQAQIGYTGGTESIHCADKSMHQIDVEA
jgi:hypothetical protein